MTTALVSKIKSTALDPVPTSPVAGPLEPKPLPDKAVPPPPDWGPGVTVRLKGSSSPWSLRNAFLVVTGLHLLAIYSLVTSSMGFEFFISLAILGVVVFGLVTALRFARECLHYLRSRIFRTRFRASSTPPPPRRSTRICLTPEQGRARLEEDLRYAFACFPRESLVHLRNQFHRLTYGTYAGHDGGTGCLFYILSEVLPKRERIVSKDKLTRHFTGGTSGFHRERPSFQPARYLVKAFDQVRLARYGGVTLDKELLWDAVEEALLERHT